MLTKDLGKRIERALLQIRHSSLLKGEMGVCVYFFIEGRKANDVKLLKTGEDMLATIIKESEKNTSLDLADGLTGIALAISYLVKNHYVEGDINEILSDIDETIYKKMCLEIDFTGNVSLDIPLTHILFYFIYRYEIVSSSNMKELMRRTIVEIFNWIYIFRKDNFYEEQFPFSLKNNLCLYLFCLAQLYRLGIERKRIGHILQEMKWFLFSCWPVLHSNRLQLMSVAAYVAQTIDDRGWREFAIGLLKKIDIHKILEEEMKDKNVFLLNGLIGIWLMVTWFNTIKGFPQIELDMEYCRRRIVESSVWDRISVDKKLLMKYYSLDGYCGVKLFLDYVTLQNGEK